MVYDHDDHEFDRVETQVWRGHRPRGAVQLTRIPRRSSAQSLVEDRPRPVQVVLPIGPRVGPGGAKLDVGRNSELVQSRGETPRAFTGRSLDDSTGTGLPYEHQRIARDLTPIQRVVVPGKPCTAGNVEFDAAQPLGVQVGIVCGPRRISDGAHMFVTSPRPRSSTTISTKRLLTGSLVDGHPLYEPTAPYSPGGFPPQD